jgi:glucose-6-phosphate 1-dehydrogenase
MSPFAHNNPTILVIFGITGDLSAKKILPALFQLHREKRLPKLFRIVGMSRRDLNEATFREHIMKVVSGHAAAGLEDPELAAFVSCCSFERGMFDDADAYARLATRLGRQDGEWKTCANKLFYLSVEPTMYASICDKLSSSGLTEPCGPDEGWTRVIVEKPIGMDEASAVRLDEMLARLFKEEQIYRIDHYLAKEMVQNILAFRFSNGIFEQSWNKDFIERIHIRLWEDKGVESRGRFYDAVGTLRDVGQNHILQMLAFLTMENPGTYSAEAIRSARTAALRALRIPSADDVGRGTFRAQYDGYRAIDGVRPDSETETYFYATAFSDAPQWKGVPITMDAGKRMGAARKEVVITFRHPENALCPREGECALANTVTISLEPAERISIGFFAKKPGYEFALQSNNFDFTLRDSGGKRQYVEEYEKLILDCIAGDQTLFIHTEEVRAMWRFIDPIEAAWAAGRPALAKYAPNEATVAQAAETSVNSTVAGALAKQIGIVGLGKMGAGMARNLMEKGWRVAGWDHAAATTKALAAEGLIAAETLTDLVAALPTPRVIWLMVPATAVDDVLFGDDGLAGKLSSGDTVIDGGNSFYKDAVVRSDRLAKKDIHFLDVGTSGGPSGARNGACLMVGGHRQDADRLAPLFRDLSVHDGWRFFDGPGAGHFVKMVHNGIEYGMMQAIAEGFGIMKQSSYGLDLERVGDIYQNGSVIESRLVDWMRKAIASNGSDMNGVSGTVRHTGEGAWTVEAAKETGAEARVIEAALQFRIDSEKNPSYVGRLLSALRGQFGGHMIK